MSNDRDLPPRWADMQPRDTGTAAPDATAEPAPTPRPGRRQRSAAAARSTRPFLLGIVATFVGLWLFTLYYPLPRQLTTAEIDQRVGEVLASQTLPPPDSNYVYGQVAPALVLIRSHVGAPIDEPESSAAPGTSDELGSGVVFSQRGDILTALHVVAGASSIEITYSDGSTAPAGVAKQEPDKDIAVLRPTGPHPGIPAAVLGDPNTVHVGDEAFVVGNPFGLYGSISAGVVSGLDRSFQMPNSSTVLEGLIQVDAAVNPGNSGGPLVDRNGFVVGIVTGLVNPSPDRVFAGIGLAVPIDVAVSGVGMPPD